MRRSRRILQVLGCTLFLSFLAKPVVIEGLSSIGPKSSLCQRTTNRAGFKKVLILQNGVYDDNETPSVMANYDDVEDDDDDDEVITGSFLASPLSEAEVSEEEERDGWYPGSFSRQENWLEEATADLLDLEEVPLGTLNEEDVESIAGIMSAWVRRRSLEAALSVERLLKRVVDDMRAGNSDICVTARMYTIAIDAWAKSGASQGAQRAQQIHDGMIALYKQTGDPNIAPSTVSFNTVMNAWCKCSDPSPENAEKVFREMVEYQESEVKPDVLTFSTLLDTYSRSRHPNAVERAEELFEMMKEVGVQRNVYTYSALQNVYARSGRPDAPDLCMKVLERMLKLYKNGDVFAKPNCVNYNAVLHAYSRTNTRQSADKASTMLEKMERPDFDGGYDVEPDRLSYALTILACARCPDAFHGAQLSEANLEKMEERARIEAKKREEISSAAPPSVTLDLESFNVVLTAISRSRQPDAALRAIRIVKRMEDYAKQGQESIAPNARAWNAILHCFSRSRDEDRGERSEQILNHMFELHKKGVKNVKPDAFSFAAVLSTYQRLGTPDACLRADAIVRHMEELYEKGELEKHPDVFHYTILCTAWAKSKRKEAAPRVVEILSTMKEKHRAGIPHIKPNVRTYDSCLDALCRAGDIEKAEQLLYHMLALARDGDKDALPDSFSFNCVISGFTRSRMRDSGLRAESLLDRFLEFSEEFPSVKPDTRSFTHIVAHYARQEKMLDAPYRAEYALNRLLSLFQSGHDYLAPNVFAFTTVMDAYALHKHKDAGEKAEQLVRTMRKLKRQYNLDELEINTGVMNNVLNAWSCSGHENAGYRADAILDDMETRADLEGETDVLPNARTYSLLMTIWSKMKVGHKAERALEILNRMNERKEQGKLNFPANDLSHSIIMNACAHTKADAETEERVFQIAVKMMTELLRGDNPSVVPTSTTFGWFFQACGRLQVDRAVKEENLERSFSACCEMGLLNDFVLDQFKQAASDELLQKMMGAALIKLTKDDATHSRSAKERLSLHHLPSEWRRSFQKQRSNAGKHIGHSPKRRIVTKGSFSRNRK